MGQGQDLRHLIEDQLVVAPDAHDLLTARLAEQVGFKAIYLGSYGSSATRHGLADQSLVSVAQLIKHARVVCGRVDIPLILDLEEGGGNAVTTYRNVEAAEKAGVAALHIEDHVAGKAYGPGGTLHPIEVAADKIRAAVDARSEMLVIGRTEAAHVTGDPDQAIARCRAFAEAGADLVLAAGLPLEETLALAGEVGKPVATFGLGGATKEELAASGVKLVLHALESTLLWYSTAKGWLEHLADTDQGIEPELFAEAAPAVNTLMGGDQNAELSRRYRLT